MDSVEQWKGAASLEGGACCPTLRGLWVPLVIPRLARAPPHCARPCAEDPGTAPACWALTAQYRGTDRPPPSSLSEGHSGSWEPKGPASAGWTRRGGASEGFLENARCQPAWRRGSIGVASHVGQQRAASSRGCAGVGRRWGGRPRLPHTRWLACTHPVPAVWARGPQHQGPRPGLVCPGCPEDWGSPEHRPCSHQRECWVEGGLSEQNSGLCCLSTAVSCCGGRMEGWLCQVGRGAGSVGSLSPREPGACCWWEEQ